MNFGCGLDIKEGWINVDRYYAYEVEYWDSVENVVPENWKGAFDFILVNHVLCTMRPSDVIETLKKLAEMLRDDGKIHIIDMDITMAIAMYQHGHDEFPIREGTLDHNFLMHVSGYGTRLSLFTPKYMAEILSDLGFRHIHPIPADQDKYDTRPLESLRFEATK